MKPKFKLVNGGDHVFRKELISNGWSDEYYHSGNTAFFQDKEGNIIGFVIYNNSDCSSRKFIKMED